MGAANSTEVEMAGTLLERLKTAFAPFLDRHEPKSPFGLNVKQGIGAFTGILVLGFLLGQTSLPLLIAPFGASTLLLFGRPSSPLSQPINLFGGYLIGSSVSFAAAALFPGVLMATAISLGISLMLMTALRVTHPPAGAIPLIAFASPVDMLELVEAVAVGSTTLMIVALLFHRIPPRQAYPSRPDEYAGAIYQDEPEEERDAQVPR
jgi:CBS-domain-containing membrane protein